MLRWSLADGKVERLISAQPKVVIELEKDEDYEILELCATELNTDLVRARPLKRFGYSGAELFLAWFEGNGHRGLPRVVKINAKSDIESEHEAIDSVGNYFDDAHGVEFVEAQERAAIVYRLISAERSGIATRQLADRVFERVGDRGCDDDLAKIFEHLYGHCCHTAHHGKRSEFQLGAEYARYRRHDFCVPRLTAALGANVMTDPVDYLGAQIIDPRYAINQLEQFEMASVVGAVHGDLHPSNVMLDHHTDPHLIDFAWAANKGHVLKDFVLMECSLRFLLFPSYVPLDHQQVMDAALLAEDGWERLMQVSQDEPLCDHFSRLGALLGAIRKQARLACGEDFDFRREYLCAQFFVLYGVLAYDDYAFHAASRVLGMIAYELAEFL